MGLCFLAKGEIQKRQNWILLRGAPEASGTCCNWEKFWVSILPCVVVQHRRRSPGKTGDTHAQKMSKHDWIRPCGISSSFGISPAVNKGLNYGLPEVLQHLNCSVKTVLKSQSSCRLFQLLQSHFPPHVVAPGVAWSLCASHDIKRKTKLAQSLWLFLTKSLFSLNSKLGNLKNSSILYISLSHPTPCFPHPKSLEHSFQSASSFLKGHSTLS